MRTHILYGLLALLAGSCGRYDGPTTASGQVVDRHSGLPVG
ncbi:hypothetical protein [Hymenobacter arcticus]